MTALRPWMGFVERQMRAEWNCKRRIMGKIVYSVVNEGELLNHALREAGFELIVGNGEIEEKYLPMANAIIPGKACITEDVLRKAPNLKIVSKYGVGYEKIDVNACTKAGVYVTNTPLANYISVAEHTLMLMLGAAKKVYPVTRRLRGENGRWKIKKECPSIELFEKTAAIIGFGNIGRRVAKLLSEFDMTVIAYDPYINPENIPDGVTPTRDFHKAISQADFVTIHVAGGSDTSHMFNMREFRMMKPTAILINTTRGSVINETDLVIALNEHIIAGAALDVLSEEPADPSNPLLKMENVLLTPHLAANTPEAGLRMQRECAKNIIDMFQNGQPNRPVNQLPIERNVQFGYPSNK